MNEQLRELLRKALEISNEKRGYVFAQIVGEIAPLYEACYDEEIVAETHQRHETAEMINRLMLSHAHSAIEDTYNLHVVERVYRWRLKQ